jgi:uncharacterized membrane protein
MTIIPYLRFLWGTTIIVNYFLETSSKTDEIVPKIIEGLFVMTFTTYCIIIGIEELKEKELVNARLFKLFGIVFEIVIFIYGFILFKYIIGQTGEIWRIALLTSWQIGLFALIFTDIKRIFISKQRTI